MLSFKGFMHCRQRNIQFCLMALFILGSGLVVGIAASSPAGTASSLAPDPKLAQLLHGVEGTYNRIKTLRMRFRQSYTQSGQVLREEAGILYLRKPGQMRWEYENPEPKLFLTDGKRLILYVPQEKRVTQSEMKNSDDLRGPMRFLLGGLKFEKDFQHVTKATGVQPLDQQDVVIQAVPAVMREQLELVTMEITPDYQIRRLVLQEPGGVQTEFRFEDQVTNVPLAPGLFRFVPPQGTEIVRQ